MCVRRRYGLRVLSFVGGEDSSLADVLVEDDQRAEIESALVEHGTSAGHDFADSGSPPGAASSRPSAPPPEPRRAVRGARAGPHAGLGRGLHLEAELEEAKPLPAPAAAARRGGPPGVEVARTAEELDRALDDAFTLHDLRWNGRPDGSGFATPVGRSFHHATVRALAPLAVPRSSRSRSTGGPLRSTTTSSSRGGCTSTASRSTRASGVSRRA